MQKLDAAQREALKQRTAKAFGRFADYHAALLEHHPVLLERVNQLLDASNECEHVSLKLRHLIWIAVDSVCTHLYERGVRIHTLFALQHGATDMEIFETLAIATRTTLRTFQDGIDIVLEETGAAGAAPGSEISGKDMGEAVNAYRKATEGEDWVDASLARSRKALAATIGLGTPMPGVLDPKSVELIALAVEACPAVLNRQGIRRHARNAARLGASQAELVEVLELASGIGLHAITIGMPIVEKALEEFKVTGGKQ